MGIGGRLDDPFPDLAHRLRRHDAPVVTAVREHEDPDIGSQRGQNLDQAPDLDAVVARSQDGGRLLARDADEPG